MKENNVIISPEGEIKKRSQLRSIWMRFCKNKLAMVGLFMLLFLAFLAITADIWFDYDTQVIAQNIPIKNQSPSAEHWFGTDQYGRDIFARVVHGTRISLVVGFVTAGIGLLFGAVVGATAGYYGGRIDNILMRIMDIFLAIPSMLLALVIVAALGQGLDKLLIATGIAQIPRFARITRSAILTLKGQEFIEAAKACGTKDRRIIAKHILPNAMGPIIVQLTLSIAMSILTVASLSFVGLGISPPTPEWGSMLSQSKELMRHYPHLAVMPGVAIVFAVMSFNLIGDGLRDALDPRLKN